MMLSVLICLFGFTVPTFAQDMPPITVEELSKLRDPFRRLITPKSELAPRTDLEAYPADQFKVVGILRGLERPRAMLMAPNNHTYFVTENQRIGTRRGIVRKIDEETVFIRERITNVIGKDEPIDIELKLAQESVGGLKTITGGW